MTKLFKEISLTAMRPLKKEDGIVENMSRVVCALLVIGLNKKVKTPNFWKLSIDFNNPSGSSEGKNFLGVLVVNRNFPVKEFLDWELAKRQDYMLKFVSETLRETFLEQSVEVSLIDGAVEYVVNKKFLNLIIGKKKFKSPFGSETAHIECEQEMDEAKIFLVITRKKEKQRLFLVKSVPEEFIFQNFFGVIEWVNETHLTLRQANGNLVPIDINQPGLKSA